MLANIYCMKYLEELDSKATYPIKHTFVSLPPNVIRWNGARCDMLIGPCNCGAWHKEEELADAKLGFIK